MLIMTIAIICIFIVGYILIAMETVTGMNKAAIALLMAVLSWSLFYMGFGATPENSSALTKALGETSEILFFLLGAMAIVEVVDANGGFNFVRKSLRSRSKRGLLWKLTIITFILSAVLDNMTTAIVMVMVLNKVVTDTRDKLIYSSMVILAANSGGAFSPIGDVTTIMLWVKGNISTSGVIKSLFLPSLASIAVPAAILSFMLKGRLAADDTLTKQELNEGDTKINPVFIIGVGGLLSVPVFRFATGLPPYMGILLILAILWIVTESAEFTGVSALLQKIDLNTILFFLGILTTIAALSETGALKSLGQFLDSKFDSNPYIITALIGVLSAVVDNVPLVASCMGMYDISADASTMAIYSTDGTFWEMLAYCAGVGGSMLIIGSAAGVVVMGLQNISFGWYLKNFSWIAAIGYLSGIAIYILQGAIQ
ncbi:MAG: sodium:proton antiporter NhaD [Bacteroidales bacterium]|nr:sodium:proton antiporter NhaD [Bacteroidales bacterium]